MKTLEQRILARVRRIYYLRKLTGPTALKAYGLVVLSFTLVSLVSLVHVVSNMPSVTAPASLVRFMAAAVLHTEWSVQAILMALVALLALMVRDIRSHMHGGTMIPHNA